MRALGIIVVQLAISVVITASVMAAALTTVPPLRDQPALGVGVMVVVCVASFVVLVRVWPRRRA